MRRIAHALALTATLALALGACASGKATGLPVGPTTPSQSKECGTIDLTDALKFVPDRCAAKVGQTVTWKNIGGVPHTVTAEDLKTFDSGKDTVINGGGEFKFTFKKTGDYPYFCRLHAQQGQRTGMVGTITVEA
jgi:plastocyanin